MNKKFINQYLPIALCGLLVAGAGFVFLKFSQNKNSQNLTVPEKYSVKGQSYGQVIDRDPGQKLEIKIGDENNLQPSFSLIKWDGEAALTMTPDLHQTVLDSQKSLTQTGSKFVYKNGQKEEVHMYGLPKSSLNPEGGYEIEWVLNEKPSGNVFNFNLETTGLEYYFQPPLTEEPRLGEVCTQTECRKNGKITRTRAENVIGSYAVYATGKKDNYKDLGGKNYGTGKVGHIYRPLIIDNNGKKVWAKLNIDKQSKLLTVNVPREFLDSASYPVIVDPTFGYTTVGASEDTSTFIQNSYVLAQSNPTTNGTLTSISTYGRNGGSGRIDCALYSNKAGPLPDARLAFNDLGPTIDNVSGWDDCPLVYSGLTSGTQYWLAYQEEYVNYDSGSGTLRYNPLTGAANWPAVADDTSTFNAIWSIYGTYTSAAPITVKGGFKILGGSSGGGEITSGTGTEFSDVTAGTDNFSINVTAGSNTILFVSMAMNNSASGVSAVTYNGVSMIELWDEYDGCACGTSRSSAWILANPATGSNTLSITWTGDGLFGFAQPWYGVAQGGTEGTTWRTPTFGDDGTTVDTTASITASNAQSGDMVLDAVAIYDNAITADASQHVEDEKDNVFGSSYSYGASSKSATGATTMQWTWTPAKNWAMGVVPLIPATVAGTPGSVKFR